MVATAPLPAGFVAPPLDADTLPPAPATPAMDSSTAQPSPAAPQRIIHAQGYSNISAKARQNYEAGEAIVRQMAGPPILHASARAAERRAREGAAEAARRTAPDPRGVLRAAIGMRAEAAAEVDRLAAPLARARQLVDNLERRQQEHAAAVVGADQAGAAALIEALAAGTAAAPPAPADAAPNGANGAEALPRELRIARLACDQLEAEDRAARDLLERRTHGVARCAVAVLLDRAARIAEGIVETADELARQRADLDALMRLVTAEGRRLHRVPPAPPGVISRALYPADRHLTGTARPLAATDWQSAYQALVAGDDDQE
jgi:hypothetical protein